MDEKQLLVEEWEEYKKNTKELVDAYEQERARLSRDIKVLKLAFAKSCQFLRENPAMDMDAYFKWQLTKCLCGGSARDPKGNEYQIAFMAQAIEELKKDGEI